MSKDTFFGACNWLIACCVLIICAVVSKDLFSPPPHTKWIPPVEKQLAQTPSPIHAIVPPQPAAPAAVPGGINGLAARINQVPPRALPEPVKPLVAEPERHSAVPETRAVEPAPKPPVERRVMRSPLAGPIPSLNPSILPAGMENEDNPNPQPRR